jgi:hypothetical protein
MPADGMLCVFPRWFSALSDPVTEKPLTIGFSLMCHRLSISISRMPDLTRFLGAARPSRVGRVAATRLRRVAEARGGAHGRRETRDTLQATALDAGLAAFKNCKQLTFLNLDRSAVTDAGLVHVAGMEALAELHLTRTKVTAEGVQNLAKALPKCKIAWDEGTIEPKK